MAVSTSNFKMISKQIDVERNRRIQRIEVSIEATNAGQPEDSESRDKARAYITDIMLQGGTIPTSWVGHVSEIQWSFGNV